MLPEKAQSPRDRDALKRSSQMAKKATRKEAVKKEAVKEEVKKEAPKPIVKAPEVPSIGKRVRKCDKCGGLFDRPQRVTTAGGGTICKGCYSGRKPECKCSVCGLPKPAKERYPLAGGDTICKDCYSKLG